MDKHKRPPRDPAGIQAHLYLPEQGPVAMVEDLGHSTVFRLGDHHAEVVLDAGPRAARELADTATLWADLEEARDRGEDVCQWGSWALPADSFGDQS
jgi:hypothetical protein